jgi:sec-independent protein translocase protein TatC
MSADPDKLAEGTLLSHLLELRTRMMHAVIAVVLVFVPCAYFANDLFEFFSKPLVAKLPKNSSLIATSVMSPFTTPFKLAFYTALFLAMPYVLYQVWAFVAPGLYRKEKKFAVPLLVSSIALFYIGAFFAYAFVFPVMFEFFAMTTPKGVQMMTDINNYLDFALTMFFAFGVAFEVPVAVVLLTLTGMVKVESLSTARGYVIIGIFVIAAFLTPADAISMCLMAIPMCLLYEGGIIMARIMDRSRKKDAAAADAAGGGNGE